MKPWRFTLRTIEPRHFGTGWISGVLAAALGFIGLGAVVCFHYPSIFTVPELRTLYPLDREAILSSIKKTSKALIVHEDNLTGGIGGEISAIIAERAFEYLDAPIRRLASPDVPPVAFSEPLESAYMLTPDKIAAAIRELAAY